ncbi:MAG: hypothetical protein NT163_10340 [Chlorobiales bacterium]|nr:hypothetical protein [Chlorobiales bacterium]
MKSTFRIPGIAVITLLLFSNAAYARFAHSNSDLSAGKAMLKSGHYKEAIASLTKAIANRPRLAPAVLANAFFDRAIAERALGKREAAKSDFRRSIDVDPTPINSIAYRKRGFAKSAVGDREGAQSDFKMAVSLGDNTAKKWVQVK